MAARVGGVYDVARCDMVVGINITHLQGNCIGFLFVGKLLCGAKHAGAEFIIGVKKIDIITACLVKTAVSCCRCSS